MFDLEQLQTLYTTHGVYLDLEQYPDFAGPLYTAAIPGGDRAIEIWEQLRQLTEQTGYWPLITAGHWYEEGADDLFTEDWLAQAESCDVDAWFASKYHQLPEPADEAEVWAEFMDEFEQTSEFLELPLEVPANAATRYHTPYELLSEQPVKQLVLTLVPTKLGWEAAAYLGFGDWNECPAPPIQVAIQKYWFEHYGAEPVIMTGDVLEMRVTRPPQTEDEALKLAQQQYLFCDDIVNQGTQTIDNLKKTLLNSPLWFFWWD